jgi:hypothetical protein
MALPEITKVIHENARKTKADGIGDIRIASKTKAAQEGSQVRGQAFRRRQLQSARSRHRGLDFRPVDENANIRVPAGASQDEVVVEHRPLAVVADAWQATNQKFGSKEEVGEPLRNGKLVILALANQDVGKQVVGPDFDNRSRTQSGQPHSSAVQALNFDHDGFSVHIDAATLHKKVHSANHHILLGLIEPAAEIEPEQHGQVSSAGQRCIVGFLDPFEQPVG